MVTLTVRHNENAEPERVVELSAGQDCTIGRSPKNAVVLNDVPSNSIAVGIPAKIKSRTQRLDVAS